MGEGLRGGWTESTGKIPGFGGAEAVGFCAGEASERARPMGKVAAARAGTGAWLSYQRPGDGAPISFTMLYLKPSYGIRSPLDALRSQ